jgi:hypothetical protein
LRPLRVARSIVIVALLGSQLGCEDLGLDPAGRLACSPPPQNACPNGFVCGAGRCWRNGTFDAHVDSLTGESRSEAGNESDERLDTGVTADQASAADIPLEAPSAEVATVDAHGAEDVRSPDGSGDTPSVDGPVDLASTCGACASPPSNGHATCNGSTCSIVCDSEYRNCPGTQLCIRSTACCADAECPTNTPSCVSGQCKARANNDPCSSDTECGSAHCAATAAGATTKVCCDSACTGNCVNGCAGGRCQFKSFRTACGEIDNSPYTPRYFTCDGNGNCNPPAFHCNGTGGDVCAATNAVACCGDPNNGYMLACVTPATCASQNNGDFEMSCSASIDCPVGSVCCSEENLQDVFVTGCAMSCQTFSTHGRDPTSFTHNQLCDLLRDPSCPAGKTCQVDQVTGLGMCSP